MQGSKNIQLYCALMEEIKLRFDAILDILTRKHTTLYPVTNIEFICLQIRKILELIAMGSLVANKKEFEKQNIKFESFWNARKMLEDIEKLNPDFYPQPMDELPSTSPRIKRELKNIKDNYLTKKEFVKLYKKCGKLMHRDNPFGSKADLNFYEKSINEWLSKINNLLKVHAIKLLGDDTLYLIHMQEAPDGKVHEYVFAKQKITNI